MLGTDEKHVKKIRKGGNAVRRRNQDNLLQSRLHAREPTRARGQLIGNKEGKSVGDS